ncbi:MAG TPA: twin-arginine translocase subunit TatC [Planctomycetota bacterium]|nr:twin-arginine translocase subunit TatC [Planctomycetota bacterium]
MRPDQRMPLRQHLIELRGSLLRCFAALVVTSAVAFYWNAELLEFVIGPWTTARAGALAAGYPDPGLLTVIGPAEGMVFALRVAFLFGMLAAAPVILWELWRFIGVGLLAEERRLVHLIFFPALLLFAAGVVFGWLALLPVTLQVLATYLDPAQFRSNVTVSQYFSFVSLLTLVMGFVFETPLVMWSLVRVGLVGAAALRKARRIAMLVALFLSAVLTPTTDAVTMLFVAVPMIVLYEVGLLAAIHAQRRRERAGERRLG